MSEISDSGGPGVERRGEEATGQAPSETIQAASIARYKKMYDRASALARIGVWECDLATEALTWTDGVYDLFDLPRGSPLDRAAILDFYDDESRRELERVRSRTIEKGGSFAIDVLIRTVKGDARWIRITGDVEREGGRSVRIFGTKQDITAEKLAQDKVRSLQAELIHVSRRSAMGAMAATLAHELNQPLAAISNYAAGMRRSLQVPEEGIAAFHSGLEAIERTSFRAGKIIRSLREMTDGSALRRELVDPNPLILEAASLAMTGADSGIVSRVDLADGELLSVDPVQIQQVFINLIRNACEAVRDSSRRDVAISTRIGEGVADIRVEDTGPGIDPDMLESLFEPFVSTKAGGMGVGLSISRTIVEAHGGFIAAANRDGGGACFRVVLPLGGDGDD